MAAKPGPESPLRPPAAHEEARDRLDTHLLMDVPFGCPLCLLPLGAQVKANRIARKDLHADSLRAISKHVESSQSGFAGRCQAGAFAQSGRSGMKRKKTVAKKKAKKASKKPRRTTSTGPKKKPQ